LEINEEDKETN